MKAFISVLVLFFICFSLVGCSDQNQTPNINVQQEGNDKEKEYLAYGGNKSTQSNKKNSVIAINNSEQLSSINAAPYPAKTTIILDIPIIKQNPELKYGCEVTSLAMVLKHAGVKTNKLKLADELPKDTDLLQKNESGDIIRWGNPNHGFVGDVTGKTAGFAVYVGPLEKLMKQYLQNRTVNLTKKPFDEILAQIKNGKPVILWTTGDYKIPDRWESWKHGTEKINTPLDLHAVVLVGFDKEHLYINDPLTGKKAKKTKKDSFLKSWIALGQQALSYN